MVLVLLLAFFALSHLALLHSAGDGNSSKPDCPPSFECKKFGLFQYPFYNTTTDPRCGLCKLNCSEEVPTIQPEEDGRRYEIIGHWQNNTFVIRDPVFQKQLNANSCDAFNNLTFPNSPIISFIFFEKLTLFRCLSSRQTDDFFKSHAYDSYKNCIPHNLYYRYSNDSIPLLTNLPPNCEVIQLPVKPPGLSSENPTELFSLLSADFYLTMLLSESCRECRDKKKGLCLIHNAESQCEYTKEGRKNTKLILGLAIGGSALIIIIACLVLFVILLCFKWVPVLFRKKTQNYLNVENFLKNHESLAPKRYSYSDIKKMTSSFKVKLGQGGYGSVYRGTLCNGNLVAVKVLNESKGNGEEFINEVASVGKTFHVNIVSLLGFCFEGRQRALIYEFMPNGSLEKFIYDRSSLIDRQLGWEKLYQIAIGIARGLEYLHRGCNTRILHFDIKPHNILLDKDFCPKISDFGLAKLFPDKRSVITMSHMRGTPGYIAPELFSRNFGGVSHRSDVYSYGMMVLEMVGGRKNIEVEVDHTSEIYFPHWIYKKLELDEELGLHNIVNEEEKEKARKMIIVGLWCIQTNPSNRPSITRVLDMLERSSESLEIPPKPFLSSPSRSPDSSTVEFI